MIPQLRISELSLQKKRYINSSNQQNLPTSNIILTILKYLGLKKG